MLSVDTAVLGTDPWGVHLAQRLQQSSDTALIGAQHDRNDYKKFHSEVEQHVDPPSIDNQPDSMNDLPFRGGTLFDLETTDDGILLAVQKNGELTTVHTNKLAITAPVGPDIVADGFPVPGADSAVTGLIIDQFDVDFEPSTEAWFTEQSPHKQLLALSSGFRCRENGQTTHDNLYVFGLARSGFPRVRSVTVPEELETAGTDPKPAQHSPSDFEWQDESMPDGFVETKTTRLRNLMNRVLVESPPSETEPLVQEIEGLAGEIDSYSRFRPEPGLRRLRWKMLSGMNLIRPFLVETAKPTS